MYFGKKNAKRRSVITMQNWRSGLNSSILTSITCIGFIFVLSICCYMLLFRLHHIIYSFNWIVAIKFNFKLTHNAKFSLWAKLNAFLIHIRDLNFFKSLSHHSKWTFVFLKRSNVFNFPKQNKHLKKIVNYLHVQSIILKENGLLLFFSKQLKFICVIK